MHCANYSFEGKLYNGVNRSNINGKDGCSVLGVENQKEGYMTRGIIIDIPRMNGIPYLEPGQVVTAADLE